MVCLLLLRYILNTKPSCSLPCCYTREFLTPIVNSRYARQLFRQLCCRNSRQRHVTPDDFYRNIIISGYSVHHNHNSFWPPVMHSTAPYNVEGLQSVSKSATCFRKIVALKVALSTMVQYNTIRCNNFYFSTIIIKAFPLMWSWK